MSAQMKKYRMSEEIAYLLGREETMNRLKKSMEKLAENA